MSRVNSRSIARPQTLNAALSELELADVPEDLAEPYLANGAIKREFSRISARRILGTTCITRVEGRLHQRLPSLSMRCATVDSRTRMRDARLTVDSLCVFLAIGLHFVRRKCRGKSPVFELASAPCN